MKKRLLAMTLAALLILALVPTGALAAAGDFEITDGVLRKYKGSGGDVVIPNGVTAIGEGAFRGSSNVTSVTIPDSVTSIGREAFYYCKSLTSVTIGNGVTSIGEEAFSGCWSLSGVYISDMKAWCGIDFSGDYSNPLSYAHNLYLNGTLVTDLVIPNGVTSIGDYAFSGCKSLIGVTIPDSVTSIGEEAFSGCTSLTDVTIPNSVTSIGGSAFSGCTSLTGVYISDMKAWCGIDFGNSSSNPLDYAHNLYLNGTLVTDLVIPDSVTSIGEYAFSGCTSLTSVTIPDSVTSIGEHAFYKCTSLTDVTIGSGVTTIGGNAFYECKNLTSVTIPASVTSIGEYAFYGCSNFTTIHGAEGSYAQIWAQDNGKTFVADLPAAATPGRTAYAATQSILVDGKKVEFQCYALKDDKGNMTNFVKLRDLAYVLNGTAAQFNVGWDGSVRVEKGKPYVAIGSEMKTPYSGNRTYAKYVWDSFKGYSSYIPALQLRDADGNGYTYYPLRNLGWTLGFNVGWAAGKGVYVETNKPYDSKN